MPGAARATATPLDDTRWFLPESLSPLAYTRTYAGLALEHRRRYNQLHATYVNEQILFFEQTLAENVLGGLRRAGPPAALDASLARFIDDERAHIAMFRELNRCCAPAAYATRDYRFVALPGPAARVLAAASRRPARFPFFVWLMLLMEERALHYGREIVQRRGELEPAFVETHVRHLRDEVHHVRWDEEILDWLWPRTSRPLRWANAVLFRWLVGEFFSVPRRAAVRVVDAWIAACPELTPRREVFHRELRELRQRTDFHASLYSRTIVPRTFARFDGAREFAFMCRVLPGYRPAGAR